VPVSISTAAVSPRSPRVAGFLLAESVSAIGSWATVIAIWGYAAYEYDASAGDVAFFGVLFTLPSVLLGPITGAVIDRLGPKATLAGAKVLGVVASLALLTATDFRALAVLSALHGISMAFSLPALQSMPPRLVGEEHVARTNALVSLTDEFAINLGPVAGGIGIAAFGFKGAFVFDALTYGLGLAVLPMVRLRPVARRGSPVAVAGPPAMTSDAPDQVVDPAPDDEPQVRFRDALEGWKLILGSGVLRRTVSCTFAVHLLYGAALLAEPLYVRDVLERPTETFAALQTVFGICLVAGGLVAAKLANRIASFRWVALGVGGSGVAAIIYLGTPSVLVAFVGVAIWGVFTALISGPSRTVLQRSSPEHTHGRILSADFMAGGTADLLGVAIAGVLVGSFGVPLAIGGLGIAVAIAAGFLFVFDRRAGDQDGAVADLEADVAVPSSAA
jgi:MFS family permease